MNKIKIYSSKRAKKGIIGVVDKTNPNIEDIKSLKKLDNVNTELDISNNELVIKKITYTHFK